MLAARQLWTSGISICETPDVLFHVGDVVAKLRKLARLSQDDLSKKARVSKGTVNDIERNSRITRAENLERVAAALGTTVFWSSG